MNSSFQGSSKTAAVELIYPPIPSAQDLYSRLMPKLGCGPDHTIEAHIQSLVQLIIDQALKISLPQALYCISEVEHIDSDGILARGMKIQSTQLAALCSRMTSPCIIVAYALTIGERLDQYLGEFTKDSLAKAFILDAAASEIVEAVADKMEDELWRRHHLEIFERTARFSPGYCDWGLSGQHVLFAMLNPQLIGIHHTNAWSVLPSKSITAIVIGARSIPFPTHCPICSAKGCP